VHIVTTRRLKEAGERRRDAGSELAAWTKIVKLAHWQSFRELRETFPAADLVDGVVIFTVRHNRHRLLAAVHYAKQIEDRITMGHVCIGAFMTHAEYTRWSAASPKKRAEWLQF
jgi:mRNA interferase HigB